MKTKLKSLCAAAIVSCAVSLSLPAGAVPASEPAALLTGSARSVENSVSPQSDQLIWIYNTVNGKNYRRLYNLSTKEWVGDWIYIGEA